MVKVKEFCCGCSLRTGTLILAWCVMIWNCIFFLIYLSAFLIVLRSDKNISSNANLSQYTLIYLLIKAIVGIMVSIIAIWAIQKKKAKYLNGLYWYFCYTVVMGILDEIFMIFNPALELEISQNSDLKTYNLKSIDIKIIHFVINLFVIALASYFALVVKSSRDYGLRNEAQHGEIDRPDPAIVGYVNHV